MIEVDISKEIDGNVLAKELHSSGFTYNGDIPVLRVIEGTRLSILVDGAENPVAPDEERIRAKSQEDLDWLTWAYAEEAHNKNKKLISDIKKVVDKHVIPELVVLSTIDKLAMVAGVTKVDIEKMIKDVVKS